MAETRVMGWRAVFSGIYCGCILQSGRIFPELFNGLLILGGPGTGLNGRRDAAIPHWGSLGSGHATAVGIRDPHASLGRADVRAGRVRYSLSLQLGAQ